MRFVLARTFGQVDGAVGAILGLAPVRVARNDPGERRIGVVDGRGIEVALLEEVVGREGPARIPAQRNAPASLILLAVIVAGSPVLDIM